jgi:phytoene dehydrogenase-like protein
VHCAIGGFSAIAKAMGRIILEQGGSIHLNSEVKEITYNRKNVTGVKLKDNRSFEANIIISNSANTLYSA